MERGRRQAGKKLKKEAGLNQLPSLLSSPIPEVGCPTLLKVLRWVTAGEGEEETDSSRGCHKALISPAAGGTWVGAEHFNKASNMVRTG